MRFQKWEGVKNKYCLYCFKFTVMSCARPRLDSRSTHHVWEKHGSLLIIEVKRRGSVLLSSWLLDQQCNTESNSTRNTDKKISFKSLWTRMKKNNLSSDLLLCRLYLTHFTIWRKKDTSAPYYLKRNFFLKRWRWNRPTKPILEMDEKHWFRLDCCVICMD